MAKKRTRRRASKPSKATTLKGSGFASDDFDVPSIPEYVVAELKYESPVGYTARGFVAPAAAELEASSLNSALERFDIAAVRSHLGAKAADIRNRIAIADALPAAPSPKVYAKKGMDTSFIQSGFVEIVPKSSSDAKRLAKTLNREESIWEAYVAPRPVPAVAKGNQLGSRNFEPSQGYLHDPPNGIGACGVWGLAGARGRKVTVCDIEGNWNRKHEDLPKGIKLIGGTVIADLGWRNHGTAVLGEIVSVRNKLGTVGISHQARAVVHSAIVGGVFNTAAAVNKAASKLKKGDVILIELPGNRSKWKIRRHAILELCFLGHCIRYKKGNYGRRGCWKRQRKLRPGRFQWDRVAERQRCDCGWGGSTADKLLRF